MKQNNQIESVNDSKNNLMSCPFRALRSTLYSPLILLFLNLILSCSEIYSQEKKITGPQEPVLANESKTKLKKKDSSREDKNKTKQEQDKKDTQSAEKPKEDWKSNPALQKKDLSKEEASESSLREDDCCSQDQSSEETQHDPNCPHEYTEEESETNEDSHSSIDKSGQDHSSHSKSNHSHSNHGEKQDHSFHHRPDGMPPAGVMGAHTHMKGKWIFDYRYMGMDMKDLLYNKNKISPYTALYGLFYDPGVVMPMTGTELPSPSYYGTLNPNTYRYMSVPVNMFMSMHMLDVMYAWSDTLMIMVMIPYVKNTMQMVANNFEISPMTSYGLGDISVTATKKFYSKGKHNFYINFGLSLPTGSIDEKDYMPMMGKSKVPYNMQPGTGSYGYLPGFAYTGGTDKFSWGSILNMVARGEKNRNSYRFGNRYEFSPWIAYKWNDWFSNSIRLHFQKWDNIQGNDPALDYKMDPQNDPNRQGGRRTDLLGGFNFYVPTGTFEGLRIQMEFGKPIYQHLNGPQLGANTLFYFAANYTL